MKNNKTKVGGVALFNGILFSSNYRQAIVQHNGDKINCRTSEYVKSKDVLSKIPILRGILGVSSQVGNATPEFVTSSGEKPDSKINTVLIYMLEIIAIIGIPMLCSLIVPQAYRSLVQAIVIILEFIIYLLAAKYTKELEKVFMYHGAEHKAVNAFENLPEEEITIGNIRKQKRFHKRCGGNFVVYLVLLTIIAIFAIPVESLLLKSVILMAVSVLNIGIAYEIINILGLLPKSLDFINYPATLIQYFTTKEPTDDMIKLAMYGVLVAGREKRGIEVYKYVNRYVKQNLKEIEYDVQDIYSILEYITKTDRNKIYLQKDTMLLSINQEIEADRLLDKYYKEKYPLQYITHKQYFFNEQYYVDENVLIPRQDSEILVEKALEYIEKENITKMIDLCTGSGALGISIAKNAKTDMQVELIDISQGALGVANRNIHSNGVYGKVSTLYSNLLEEKIKQINNVINTQNEEENKEELIENAKYEMIVSNPPYIRTEVIASLQEEVQKEPHLALDGGKTGMDFYIRIFKEAKQVLRNNGLLILEIGYDQLEEIKQLVKENNEFKILEAVKDYGGNDRVVICRFQEK